MANKTIYELGQSGTIAATDLLPIWQSTNASGEAKKVSVDQLRGAVTNTIPWANLTGDPMTNLEYKADWDAVQAQIAALDARITSAGTPIIAQGAGGGVANTVIPFPAGYNSTNSLLFVSAKYAVAGGTGNGINNFSYVITITSTGWNVANYAGSEAGNVTYPQFIYFIIKSNVVATNYNGVSSGGGSGGGEFPPSSLPQSEPVEVPEYDPYNVT